MDKGTIEAKIIELLKRYTRNDEVWMNIHSGTRIIEDLKINSARVVDVIIDIEDTFNIMVSNELMDKIKTIGDAVNVIADSKNAMSA